jgi:hypothetical protein
MFLNPNNIQFLKYLLVGDLVHDKKYKHLIIN